MAVGSCATWGGIPAAEGSSISGQRSGRSSWQSFPRSRGRIAGYQCSRMRSTGEGLSRL
ncbi:MAG: hypothetical protein IPG76_23940 [Acidobacteria bacterium]|nr:hypothetical protein [Acidobacteriota bacterium]